MKKNNICIDFDDVVVKISGVILENLGLFFNEVYDINSIIKYNISDCLKIDTDIVQDAVDIALENTDLELEKDADEVIKWLNTFYNIHIVTLRRPEYLQYIDLILKNNNMLQYISGIYCTEDKLKVTNELNAIAFIEDNPEYITQDFETTLIFDKPWNRNISNSGYIQRVHNWQEIKDYFMIKLGV